MHAASGSVATTASNGASAPPFALSKHHRYSSRSNSVSSASVVTIKRTGSLSSTSTGARSSAVPATTQSPSETSLIALRLNGDPAPRHEHKRRQSVAVDTSEQLHGRDSEGLNNLNRWSQSTNSSAASVNHTKRSRASSGAVLPSLHTQLSPQKQSRPAPDQSPRASPQRNPRSWPASQRRQGSPVPPEKLRRRASRADLQSSLTALPPLHTTPALTDPNDTESPSTTQTIQTPSTQSSYGHDYFGNDTTSPRSIAKSKRPVVIRSQTTPTSQLNSTRTLIEEPEGHHLRRSRTSEIMEGNSRPGTANRDSSGQRRSRTREKTEKDKKAMLSKALQKANTAVVLDNAQNFEGALDAYTDACRLLLQVMDRSSGVDDKRKLEAIRVTYSNRIEELRQLETSRPSTAEDKSLPARPMSDDSMNLGPTSETVSPIDASVRDSMGMSPIDGNLRDSAVIETAKMQRIVDVPRLSYPKKDRDSFFARTMEAVDNTTRFDATASQEQRLTTPEMPRRPSPELPQTAIPEMQQTTATTMHQAKDEVVKVRKPKSIIKPRTLELPPLNDSAFMPAPLSPRKPPSPGLVPTAEQAWQEEPKPQPPSESEAEHKPEPEQRETFRERANSTNSTSWLDTIDESGSSCASSVHSVSSQTGQRKRKHIRGTSGGTNPDFDVAFDAAVEAAYDEGLEPDLDGRNKRNTVHKHAPKESITVPSSDIKEVLSPTNDFHPGTDMPTELDDEEEERLLDEITQDYAQGFNFDLSSKSALPRQSDSSGYSRSTWQSSQASVDRATAASSLSTVAEDTLPTRWSEKLGGTPSTINTLRPDPPALSAPPPTTALPRPPSVGGNRLSSVRNRRLSSQSNAKQLKIETNAKPDVRKRASTFHHSPSPRRDDGENKAVLDQEFKFGATLVPTPSDLHHEQILKSPPSLDMRSAISDTSRPATAAPTVAERRRSSMDEPPGELRTTRPIVFRKNKSSLSLRDHNVLLSSPEDSAPSIVTPMSSNFMTYNVRRGQDPMTSQRANFGTFGPTPDGQYSNGGVYLFDTSLTAARSPVTPDSPNSTEPGGLEPCPESFLLRPFWLMRAIASTLTHPRGGFVTTRLFVPREVWQTRGVKLKSVEDKVANCDLLTAALGRLAGVDTYDADAVMEELQSFEEVMERVQTALAKKLGSDVGVGSVSGLFRDAASSGIPGVSTSQTMDTVAGAEKGSKSKEGKGYLNSWRKLRSKSSGTPLTVSQFSKATSEKEHTSMASVPMTSFVPVERRGQKKDARNLTFDGPNRDYMGSLARLFEGAQVLDQIARQVEDPGLKHSSPTHVGLELSIRHAAEFFGFYVCRFVLADLGTLVDKFVKRGTEWVLA